MKKDENSSTIQGPISRDMTIRKKKSSSRMNATKHGILVNCMTSYDTVDFDVIYQGLIEEFDARTTTKIFLVRQLALMMVRLNRCVRAESEYFRELLNPKVTHQEDKSAEEMLRALNRGMGELKVVSEGEVARLRICSLEGLALIYERYEPRFWSRFHKIIGELQKS